MILRPYLHTDPAVAISYLFGCGGKAAGAVVDPVESPDFYLREAQALGLAIRYVVDTHVHADHLSTGRALAEAASAEYVLHESAGAEYPFHAVRDGDQLALGNVTATVWHVPGHTPEHLALVLADRTRGQEPWLVFTGHTLMVGDLGRTELAASAESGARALAASAERLRTLPDHVLVLPGAFSGSVCGRGLSGNPVSTVGFERRFNRAFSVTDAETLVALMLRDIPPRPPRAAEIRAVNMGTTESLAGA
ncbi:MAG TPA: MBL fold metallo-hydrolase [Gemmatimonadaceae bacterium]|jgi:glyoxylase-like metal-dependent hydrolase (beta-lactamase superfamily II)|nr:MBL fold metallo-hydrolase [Gemmatimonadaceae bacterium]